MGERHTGKVKFFNTTKGFGFLIRDDGAGEVFVHANNLPDGVDELGPDDRVSFETEPSKNGKGPRAVKLAMV